MLSLDFYRTIPALTAYGRLALIALFGFGAMVGVYPPAALSQTVMSKPVKVLVGFPPGGTADFIARSLAAKLRDTYAATVIVENRPGARGAVVVAALMNAEPDGTVLYLAPHSTITLYPHVIRKLPYDPADLMPVAVVATHEFALAVGTAMRASNLQEYFQWCKANPKNALYGTLGSGTTHHFLGYMLSQATGVTLTPVPYKGAAPGVQDLLGGQIASMMVSLGDIVPHDRSGKVRILATSGLQRSRFVPDVPTFQEAGFPSVVAIERFGVFLRAGTPASIVESVNKAVLGALDQPDFRAVLEKISYEPHGSNTQEFTAIVKSEYERWRGIVRASGFQAAD